MNSYTVKREDIRTKQIYTVNVLATSKSDAGFKAAEILAFDGISFTRLVSVTKK